MTPNHERLVQVARRALQRYRDFGQLALEAWEREDVATAYNLLVRRDRAFHNFRAVDARAKHEGLELGRDRELLAIYPKIATLNAAIQQRLQAERDKTADSCAKVRQASRGLKAYADHARTSGRAA